MKKNHNAILNDLWWVPALVPLLLVVVSFLMGGWYWGLMDDQRMVSEPGSVIERTIHLFMWTFSSGRLVPTNCFHWALFYKIFANSPTGFFLFRWFELIIALGLWGLLIIDVTGKKWPVGLFMTAALGFYKFYDGFCYLSIPEPLGILLAAPATLFFFRAVKPALDQGKKIDWKLIALSFLFLLLSMGTKETFFVIAAVFGLTALLFSFKNEKTRPLFAVGLGLLFLSVCYAFIVKFFIVHGYSAGYEITNLAKLIGNLQAWLLQDLPYHAPWALIFLLLLILGYKPLIENASHLFALTLSILLYIGYTVILLPWNTGGYYCFPLGVFFALIVTMLIVDQLERMNGVLWSIVFSVILCLNVFVSSSAIQSHRFYQMDTKNLVTWIAQNIIFEHDVINGAVVRINATEPGDTIPAMVEKLYGKKYKSFLFTPSVREILGDRDTKYYLWGPHWGDQDLRLLGPLWTPVFLSDNWVMFRRMY